MKLRVRAYAIALGLLLLCAGLFACATQVAPGGGPEDKLPPRVAAVYPAPMTTNHPNELYVKLEFDEWINASIPRSAVSISPPIEKKMKFEVSGRTLELTSRAVLDENTTYTITFAGGIKDLHGNALATPFTVVFSTGSEIDSLTIAGRILVNDTLCHDTGDLDIVHLALFEDLAQTLSHVIADIALAHGAANIKRHSRCSFGITVLVLQHDTADLRAIAVSECDVISLLQDVSDITCCLLDNFQLCLSCCGLALLSECVSTKCDYDSFHFILLHRNEWVNRFDMH